MTTLCPIPTPRTIEPNCPSWCAGHNDTYQSWEDAGPNGHLRDHGEVGVVVGGIHVEATQSEHEVNGMAAPRVWVSENSQDAHNLTPDQARELAAAIVSAADRIDTEAAR